MGVEYEGEQGKGWKHFQLHLPADLVNCLLQSTLGICAHKFRNFIRTEHFVSRVSWQHNLFYFIDAAMKQMAILSIETQKNSDFWQ